MTQHQVRFLGSRELHRDLPKILGSLGDSDVRCVVTVHGKPRAVLIGAAAFMSLLNNEHSRADRLLAQQLEALARGLGASIALEEPEPELIAAGI